MVQELNLVLSNCLLFWSSSWEAKFLAEPTISFYLSLIFKRCLNVLLKRRMKVINTEFQTEPFVQSFKHHLFPDVLFCLQNTLGENGIPKARVYYEYRGKLYFSPVTKGGSDKQANTCSWRIFSVVNNLHVCPRFQLYGLAAHRDLVRHRSTRPTDGLEKGKLCLLTIALISHLHGWFFSIWKVLQEVINNFRVFLKDSKILIKFL